MYMQQSKTLPSELLVCNDIYLLPCDNNPQILAAQNRTQILTGRCLIKLNAERKVCRLQIHDRHIINFAVDHIWNSLAPFQQDQFTTLANKANNINQNIIQVNTDTLNRMTRLDILQVTNNSFEYDLFNGVSNFHGDN